MTIVGLDVNYAAVGVDSRRPLEYYFILASIFMFPVHPAACKTESSGRKATWQVPCTLQSTGQ